MYETKIKTRMTIDHEREKVTVNELGVVVNGYENKAMEKEAVSAYNEGKEFNLSPMKTYNEDRELCDRLIYRLYSKLGFWKKIVQRKRKNKKQ